MQQDIDIEMQLWEYIDGACNTADANRIALLIAEDSVWMEKYNELLSFNTDLKSNVELDTPSLRFSKNVMEAVADAHIATATKTYVNPFIIRGIAAFFILSILSVLGYALANVKWPAANSRLLSRLPDLKLDLGIFSNTAFLNGFIMLNIMLGLVLLDAVLRKKRVSSLKG